MRLFYGIRQGRIAGSIEIARGVYQLTTAAAITDKDNIYKLKKLQKKSV